MNTIMTRSGSLLSRLPPVRGSYTADTPLAPNTWFRVGGPAEVLFRPVDADDLADFLKNRPKDVPLTILGASSNVLVRDGGIAGVVIRLGKGFTHITALDSHEVKAGAAALDAAVARQAAKENIAGLEFLVGIPGSIGGALRMNAGSYGREIKDVLISAEALSFDGKPVSLNLDDMKFAYRQCGAPAELIFTAAHLRGAAGAREDIEARMDEIDESRQNTQPIRTRTGGSTFKNPPGKKAWQLIDLAGCRGLVRGDAQVSEQHCNFLINRGQATAADLEDLGESVRARVEDNSGICLEWEIKRLGERGLIQGGGA